MSTERIIVLAPVVDEFKKALREAVARGGKLLYGKKESLRDAG
jgi:ABC-type branched-subunit amino acid transport system substrate-binding protein